jgi:hypothetical protein
MINALQKVIEERALTAHLLGHVVVAPLLAAVDVEPFLLGADALERLESTAGVKTLIPSGTGH